jgi:hypothetical protein
MNEEITVSLLLLFRIRDTACPAQQKGDKSDNLQRFLLRRNDKQLNSVEGNAIVIFGSEKSIGRSSESNDFSADFFSK